MNTDRPLLRKPEFRALLGARLSNALAVSALATVVAYQTYIITHDPLSLGWLGLVEAIPALSLVLFGGHLADRRDRRSIVLLARIIRTTIVRVLSPERLRGRVASVSFVFIGASNELGAFESGVAARLIGTVPSVVAGGLVTLGVVGLVAATVPGLRRLDLGVARPPEGEPAIA